LCERSGRAYRRALVNLFIGALTVFGLTRSSQILNVQC
jgi:hypothetical protein